MNPPPCPSLPYSTTPQLHNSTSRFFLQSPFFGTLLNYELGSASRVPPDIAPRDSMGRLIYVYTPARCLFAVHGRGDATRVAASGPRCPPQQADRCCWLHGPAQEVPDQECRRPGILDSGLILTIFHSVVPPPHTLRGVLYVVPMPTGCRSETPTGW